MNELVVGTNALTNATIVVGDRFEVFITESGTVYMLDASKIGGSNMPAQYRIHAVNGDYYTCRRWDEVNQAEPDTTDIYVARPFLHRTSRTSELLVEGALSLTANYSYGSNTTRTMNVTGASSGTWNNETQYIRPQIFIDGTVNGVLHYYTIIWAIPTGKHTGVSVAGNDVDLIDMNVDARGWAQIPIDPTP